MGAFWDLGKFLVASTAVILFEQTENGNGRLHLVDGTVLPLLPDEAERVQQLIRREVNNV